jgi:hypothetical protein
MAKLYLELNYDGFLSKSVKVNKIGGFCIDLSHFKTTEKKLSFAIKTCNLPAGI